MSRAGGNPVKRRLPARAKWIFAVTLVLVSASFLARRPGVQVATWQKWLIDAPMLVMVALSSLIRATWRRDLPLPERKVPNPSETFE